MKPLSFNSSAATWTLSVSATSNSMLVCGTGQPHWPVRRAEARLRSLSQRPEPEGLAAVDVFAVQVAVSFRGQRQASASTYNLRLTLGSGAITATLVMNLRSMTSPSAIELDWSADRRILTQSVGTTRRRPFRCLNRL